MSSNKEDTCVILWVHASAKLFEDSLSSRLGHALIDMIKGQHDHTSVIERDTTYIPHLDFETIQRFVTSSDEYTETLSASLVDELKQANIIVVSTPMWNFNIPSSLKAWIDHVIVKNQTYAYTNSGVEGLLTNKKVVINVTSGGNYEANSIYDNITNYMTLMFNFMGIKDVEVVWTSNTSRLDTDQLMTKTTEAFKSLKMFNSL